MSGLVDLAPSDQTVAKIKNASAEVITGALDHMKDVIVQPITDALTGVLAEATAHIAPAVEDLAAALRELPEIAGKSAGRVLDEVEGLTVTATVTLTVTRGARKA